MTVISGGIFNFSEGGYSPPTWSGGLYSLADATIECFIEWVDQEEAWLNYTAIEWSECEEPFTFLNQIATDENFVYAATTDGLNIIDLVSEQAYAHLTYYGGFNSVWADDTKVYLATPNNGIKYIEKTCISGSITNPYELATCLTDYLNEPDILSNITRYIHGNNSHMIASTASGVSYRGPDPYYQRASGFTKLARKVFITPSGKMYYVTWDGSTWKINVKNADNQDWTTPDKVYSSMFTEGIDITDIFVDNDLIYVATSNGIYVINDTSEDIEYSVYLVEV